MHYFIGLDNGGTATKAALFDRNGKEIGKAVVATASITPSGIWRRWGRPTAA